MKETHKTIKEIYLDCFRFIRQSKNYLLFVISLFLLFAVVGYFLNIPSNLEQRILYLLNQIANRFEGLNVYQMIWAIFSNNVTVSFLVIFLGVVFGIFPIFTSATNGVIIGYVAKKAVSLNGITILWKLFPHGIFELPAVLLSLALGVKLGFELFKKKTFRNNLKNSFYIFLLVVVPLLAIAAIIEGLLVYLIN